MNGGNLSSFSRDDAVPRPGWGGSGSHSIPQGDVGSVLDKRDGGVAGGDARGDDSANIVWGVALVAAPIVIVLLLLGFRAAAEARRASTSANKRREGRRERYRTVEEREGSYRSTGSPDPVSVYVHAHGDWKQWAQATRTSTLRAEYETDSRSVSFRGAFVRPPRSSSLEDFRHDTHQPGNPDVIWRNTTYSF